MYIKSYSSPLKEFFKNSVMHIYRSHEKGELNKYKNTEKFDYHGFSSVVSDREWDDLEGQFEGALNFLKKYETEILKLKNSHHINDIRLDFPCKCRLDENTLSYSDYLPAELLNIAGKLGG